MVRKKLRAILFGPQGCGKGTQGQLLSERYDVPFIGAGDLFRDEIEAKSPLGNLLSSYVNQGLLAPDEVVDAVIAQRLKKHDLSHGFLLDGYPRNVVQATHLQRLLDVNLAIYIKISDAESIRRLTGRLQCRRCKATYHTTEAPPVVPGICSICGGKLTPREDDQEEAIRKRLATFHFMTEPMATFFRQHGVLLTVNGEQPIAYVFEELTRKMVKLGF